MINLQAIAPTVISHLKECPGCRDDDLLLISMIWQQETFSDQVAGFLSELQMGMLTHPESIRRTRQKLQEKYPDLRGNKWKDRHGAEALVCQQLMLF